MASKFKVGDKVRYVVPDIEGEVVGAVLNSDTLEIAFKVEWTDAEGTVHARFFEAGQLELQPQPQPEE